MNRERYNAYQREYQKQRYHRRKQEWLQRLGGKCVKCGSEQDLEIDHIDPATKSFNLTASGTHSEVKITAELAKCQALCKPCHTEKSVLESGKTLARGTHGTLSAYRYCKCAECREAWNKHNREYKRKKTLASVAKLVTASDS